MPNQNMKSKSVVYAVLTLQCACGADGQSIMSIQAAQWRLTERTTTQATRASQPTCILWHPRSAKQWL